MSLLSVVVINFDDLIMLLSGGKMRTYHSESDEIPHELGTCYLHPGYGVIRELLKV